MSDKEELDTLRKTFEEFISTSTQLQHSYEVLKEESHRLSLYLSNILENMSSAVLVFDNALHLTLWNGMTRMYFPHLEGKDPPVSLEELAGKGSGSRIDIGSILEGKEKLYELETEVNGEKKWLEIDSSDFLNNRLEKIGYLLVIHDKTELKKLQVKSRQEERLRVMGELAAEVAHEIRNPLGSIELMVTLLQEDVRGNEHGSNLLSRIRTSVDNMNHIVTNILLYTRELQPEWSEFPLAELLDAAESIALNTIVKNRVTVEKNPGDILMKGDFELLKQSIANVLINAAQAVPPGGVVRIDAENENDVLRLKIRDNGPGIPDAIRDKVFKPFFTTKNTGTGLGLAMVKRVVEAHEGTIFFESGAGGTLFIFEIPLK